MRSRFLATVAAFVALYVCVTGCAAMDAVLDYPMSVFDDETGEETVVPLGDVIADNADGAGGVVSGLLTGVNPLAAGAAGAAAAALFGGARRKKKKVAVETKAPAEEPEAEEEK